MEVAMSIIQCWPEPPATKPNVPDCLIERTDVLHAERWEELRAKYAINRHTWPENHLFPFIFPTSMDVPVECPDDAGRAQAERSPLSLVLHDGPITRQSYFDVGVLFDRHFPRR